MAADPETERWLLGAEKELTECFQQNAIRFGIPDPSGEVGFESQPSSLSWMPVRSDTPAA